MPYLKIGEVTVVEDLIAITASFSARMYGKRGGKKKDEIDIRKMVEGMFS